MNLCTCIHVTACLGESVEVEGMENQPVDTKKNQIQNRYFNLKLVMYK